MAYNVNWTVTGDKYALRTKTAKGSDGGAATAEDPKLTANAAFSLSSFLTTVVAGFFNENLTKINDTRTITGDGMAIFDGSFTGDSFCIQSGSGGQRKLFLNDLTVRNYTEVGRGQSDGNPVLIFPVGCVFENIEKWHRLEYLYPPLNVYFKNNLFDNVGGFRYQGTLSTSGLSGQNTFVGCSDLQIERFSNNTVAIYDLYAGGSDGKPTQIYYTEEPNKDWDVFDKDGNVEFKIESTYGVFNDAFRTISDLRTYCISQGYITKQDSDDLQFLRQVMSYAFYNNITTTDLFFQNCRMVGAGEYSSDTEIGFLNTSKGDYRLKSTSIAANIGWNKENAGVYGIGERVDYDLADFPTRTNLDDNGYFIDYDLEASCESVVLGNNIIKQSQTLSTQSNIALRNNEVLRPWYNYGAAISAGGTLVDSSRYSVSGSQVTYNSVVYEIGDVVDVTTAGGLTHAGGDLIPFVDLVPNMIISIKATQQSFPNKAAATVYFDSTLKWCHFDLCECLPQANFDVNGDLIAGDADNSNRTDSVTSLDSSHTIFNYNSGNAVNLEYTWMQVRFDILPDEIYWRD